MLLDLIALADKVLESVPDGVDTDEYETFIQKTLSHAKSFRCKELVQYDRRDDRYYLSEELTDNMDLLTIMKAHTTEVFWIELPRQLAIRDMMEKYGTTQPEGFSVERTVAAFLVHAGEYESELMENGLDNLRIEGLTVSGRVAQGNPQIHRYWRYQRSYRLRRVCRLSMGKGGCGAGLASI